MPCVSTAVPMSVRLSVCHPGYTLPAWSVESNHLFRRKRWMTTQTCYISSKRPDLSIVSHASLSISHRRRCVYMSSSFISKWHFVVLYLSMNSEAIQFIVPEGIKVRSRICPYPSSLSSAFFIPSPLPSFSLFSSPSFLPFSPLPRSGPLWNS